MAERPKDIEGRPIGIPIPPLADGTSPIGRQPGTSPAPIPLPTTPFVPPGGIPPVVTSQIEQLPPDPAQPGETEGPSRLELFQQALDTTIGPSDRIVKAFNSIDLVEDVNWLWTTNTSPQARALVPKIEVQFYQQNRGQLIEAGNRFIDATIQAINNGVLDADIAYTGMYLADFLGQINFPFFSTDHASIKNDFGDRNILSRVGKIGGKKAGGVGRALIDFGATVASAVTPGFHWENTRTWSNISDTSTSFGFNLYNTIGKNTRETIILHKALVDRLIALNTIQKYGPSLILPPAICSYSIQGVRYSPVAHMNLEIKNEGQLTQVAGIGVVPDAYSISIELHDMIKRSRNFHGPEGPRGQSVNVIDDSAPELGSSEGSFVGDINTTSPTPTTPPINDQGIPNFDQGQGTFLA